MNYLRRKPGRLEGQNGRLTWPEAHVGRESKILAGSTVLWTLALQIHSPLSPQSCVNLGKPLSQSLPLAMKEFVPFASCRYTLLEESGFLLWSQTPFADSGVEDNCHHKKQTLSPDSQVSSAAIHSGHMCVTPATPRTSGCSHPISCQTSSEQYCSPLSCGFRRHI